MDNDSKHVLTILGLVACFGAGYFVYGAENKETMRIGEKFSIFGQIENILDGEKEINYDEKAIENAVNAYYQTDDSYFEYSGNTSEDKDAESVKLPEFANKYQMIDNIVYINSHDFFMDGIQGFTHYFSDNPTPDCDGFIIDLRENIGGITDYSMGMLGYFLEPQEVGEYNYYKGDRKTLKTSGTKKTNGEKVVILVNEKTASSAEIFVSAMKQFYDGNITIIGTQTRGKGSFQEFVYLPDNEQFKYTAGTYTVGTWQCYDGVGITPDIEIPMDYENEIICTADDVQFQSALDLFK